MSSTTANRRARTGKAGVTGRHRTRPGQIVLVLQGGGALGAYQAGVYQALHEAGVEPDWVIGTSIGAINAALIAGNPPERRLRRLHEFWSGIESHVPRLDGLAGIGLANAFGNAVTFTSGVPGFFEPNPLAWLGPQADLGVDRAAFYSTAPLRRTLASLVDFVYVRRCATRLTVGAVNLRTAEMRYFDSRDGQLRLDHVMASAAIPPAFPAVEIDGEWYWDGGIYSNTPIEAVLHDRPRRDSLIFAAALWQPAGDAPRSIGQVLGRQKDIQFASRAASHIDKQKQLHHLRHIIRELARRLPPSQRAEHDVQQLASWGCATTMHVVQLLAPRLDGEDHTKDIDFAAPRVRARWQAGHEDARTMLEQAPWEAPCDPMEGVVEHRIDRSAPAG